MTDVPSTDANSRFIAELAKQSAGGIEIIHLKAPLDAFGVPGEIPVAYRNGKEPMLFNLAPHFEPWRTAPERRTGTAKADTLASFIALVNRHKDENSAIFAAAKWPGPKLTAVIDYNTLDGLPQFCRHRVEYAFPVTPEFTAWITQDGKPMEQLEFARFLEDHAAELAAPFPSERAEFEPLFKERFATPNELIGLSRSLEVFVGCKVKRSERLQTGERSIVFEQSMTNAAGAPVDIPGIFMIAMPAFVDGEPVRIPARLRFRAGGSELKWHYNLYRWQEWLRRRVQEDLAHAAGETGLPAFEGAPETP
jgi:hypothetical protein